MPSAKTRRILNLLGKGAAAPADEESGMQWGDIGMLLFWVTKRGLKEENFDDVWVVLQTT